MLEAAMGRLLELKAQLVKHCGEYVNYDDALVDLKLTPDMLEIPIPRFFIEDRKKELEERNRLLGALIKQYGQSLLPEETPKDLDTNAIPLTVEQAIFIVQTNERGRQGRQRARFMKEIREQEERERKILEFGSAVETDPRHAAVMIQKVWKGYVCRKRVAHMRQEEIEFLAMDFPKPTGKSPAQALAEAQARLQKTFDRRKVQQGQRKQEYDQELQAMRLRIKDKEGGLIMEQLHDQIIEKLITLRQVGETGTMPEFPTEEEGGSAAFLKDEPALSDEQALEDAVRRKKEEDLAKKPGGAAQQRKGSQAKNATAKKPGKAGDEEEEDGKDEIKASKFWKPFADGYKEYVEVWNDRFDPLDFKQPFEPALLRDRVMEGPGGLMQDLRSYVDHLVRIELANLRSALDREKLGKLKKPGKKNAKPRLTAKERKEAAARARKEKKDLTADKKIESLVNELVWTGMLCMTPDVKLADYLGTFNVLGSVQDQASVLAMEQLVEVKKKWQAVLESWNESIERSLQVSKEQFAHMYEAWAEQKHQAEAMRSVFEPSMAQVREVVTTQVILPLGCKNVWESAPHHNTFLIYGPAGTGKTLLTYAIAAETGATFFNLSPQNIEGKYLGPRPTTYLLHMVFKTAKAMAPAVIYIDQVEKIFPKRGGKKKGGDGAGSEASRIKKDLLMQVKDLEPEDRVVVIGNSRCPWEADQKELLKFFGSICYCVQPDYPSRALILRALISSKIQGIPPRDAMGSKGSIPAGPDAVRGAGGVVMDELLLLPPGESKPAKLPDGDSLVEQIAYLSNKYTAGSLVRVVESVLTNRRIKRVSQRPLEAGEFLGPLSRVTPVFREEFDSLKTWTKSLPYRLRKRRPEDLVEEEEDPRAKGKGKAPDKKR
eukprot:NODE_86_length_2863_cov_102.576048_g67_i0.p1 GENE.NODE_86_length_2863_cov_102.576048_g67_i0~~NODE_86_length_2863_cov_102.576048_g67_i0.p1  ORF type:complete len:938 (+),score=336.68 NODE_86_length_2863_cov_102.576048_g67_i0:158-2815(+)